MKFLTFKLPVFGLLLLLGLHSFAASPVTWRVTDAENNPITGAEVLSAGKVVAVSSAAGELQPVGSMPTGLVTVSAEGYTPRQVRLAASGKQQIVLSREVVIKTPYFERAASSFNGATSSVTGSQLKDVPSMTASNSLTGRLPGLITIQSTGEPGYDGVELWIRGRRTDSEGVLVLIDGHPGSLTNLQATDIESVTVLKDASATALYGMRAANGAVLLQTKRGVAGKMRVNVSANTGYQQFTQRLNRVDAATFAGLYNEAMYNENPLATPLYSASDIAQYADGSDPLRHPDVDWYGDLLRDGTWTQRYNVDISGGSKAARYYVALGAQMQSGMYNTEDEFTYSTNTEFSRYFFKSNIDFNVTKTTEVGVGMTMRFERRNYPGGTLNQSQVFNALMQTPPNAFPMYFVDDGSYVDNTGNRVVGINGKIVAGSAQTSLSNAWGLINRRGYSIDDNRYGVVNLTARQRLDFLTEGLSLNAHLSSDIYNSQVIVRNNSLAMYELMPDNTLTQHGTQGKMSNTSSGSANQRNTTFDIGLGYQRTCGPHDFSANVFWNQYEAAADYQLPTRYMGLAGMVSYTYDNRYSADITCAYQGSNLLPGKNRYVFTPALAVGWTVSNEGFLKDSRAVSHLKLRASVGQVANSRSIGYYDYISAMTSVSATMQEGVGTISNYPGYDVTKVGNPDLKPETALQWNAGVDASFLHGRLTFTGDYFQDHRDDMYMSPTTFSDVAGFYARPSVNIGQMKSEGFELSASWSDRIGELHYTLSGNFTKYANEIVNIDEPIYPYAHMYKKGNPIEATYGLIAVGYYRDQADIDRSLQPNFSTVAPGDLKYASLAGLPYVDATYDQTMIGYGRVPRVFYAANVNLRYKGIDLGVMFQGAAQATRVWSSTMRNPFTGLGSFYDFQMDRWTDAESVDAKFPRLTTTASQNNNRTSTHWVKDASYLRLKTAELGYTFPYKWTRKAGIEKLRIFTSGYNLLILSDKIKVTDPEGNADGSSFPVPRIYNIGINLTF